MKLAFIEQHQMFHSAAADSDHDLPVRGSLLNRSFKPSLSERRGRATPPIFRLIGARGSMSRKGDCWDNAATETLFGSFEVERPHGGEVKPRPPSILLGINQALCQ